MYCVRSALKLPKSVCVRKAAEQHHDAHVRKMLLEYTQLLCTAFPEPVETARWLTPAGWKKATPDERIRANTLPYSMDRGPAPYTRSPPLGVPWSRKSEPWLGWSLSDGKNYLLADLGGLSHP